MPDEHPRLKNAPIVEAAIGIRLDAIDQSLLKKIEELSLALKDEYLLKEEATRVIEEGKSIRYGYRLRHRENKYAFSVMLDWFSFSRFHPYDTWEDLTDNAERIWNHYLPCFLPLSVRSFGIRYINDLPIPDNAEVTTLFKTYIEVPKDFVSSVVNNMFFRIEMPLEENGVLTLQQALREGKSPPDASIILDYQLQYSALGMTSDQLWSAIRSKRKRKNQVFWGCITPEMEARLK